MAVQAAECIDMEILTKNWFVKLGKNSDLNYLASTANPMWHNLTEYCRVMDTHGINNIHLPPDWLAKMIKDKIWRAKIIKHLKNRRDRHRKNI